MATDPIKIPIVADNKASAEIRKVAGEVDKLDKKKVSVGVDTGQSSGIIGKLTGAIGSIGPLAAGAGAALGAVGAAVGSLVGKWQDLALEVGKFRDATGVSADEASRFVELAKDMGLSVDTVQSMIGKLNRTAGQTPQVFTALGVEIAKTRDGAVDVQSTFLNAIDTISAMTDPTEQAAAATKLFGRNWQDAAELIVGGADNVKERLDSLTGSKLVDDNEIAKAREARDNFDHLHDAIENVTTAIGQDLAPILAKAADELGGLIDKVDQGGSLLSQGWNTDKSWWHSITSTAGPAIRSLQGIFGPVDGLQKKHKDLASAADTAAAAQSRLYEATKILPGSLDTATLAQQRLYDATKVIPGTVDSTAHAYENIAADLDRATAAADRNKAANDRLRGSLNMKHESEQLGAQIYGAMLTAGKGAQVASDDVYNIQQGIIDVGEYAHANPIDIQTAIEAADRGDWDAVASAYQRWANANPIELAVRLQQQNFRNAASSGNFAPGGTAAGVGATAAVAGPSVGATAAPVVPVTVTVPRVNVTVNAGMVADTGALVRAMTRAERSTSRIVGARWREVAAA